MPEIMSFDDATRVKYRGSQVLKFSRDPKIVDYSPRKRPEISEITSFDDAARVGYLGTQGIEILSEPKNHGP